MPTATHLDPDTTYGVMLAACRQLGINSADSQLIRLGENALFRLNTEPTIVRVGRSIEESRKEVAVSLWLNRNGIPGTELAYPETSLLVIDGLPVTFWKLIEVGSIAPTADDLGYVIKALHALPEPTSFRLPKFEPMPKIDGRIEHLREKFDAGDISFIQKRKSRIEDDFCKIRSVLGWGPLHGDAHIGNLMRDKNGTIRLIDYGDFCFGPREWDVCTLAVSYKVGTVPESTYRSFANAYGFDALQWDGFPTVQAARELNMTTWLMQLGGHSKQIDAEIRKRLADLRNGSTRRWEPF
ncbi:phosphotransferase enzyme family protein [Nocardia transvalensis]|uniref:phosphotransferase enzyme family protein n=1 Tax=Nocardia transvalensis TaxID=37333 RepID=UPI0018934D7C|nr:aminoglycoside phosphotransferase family protein [Nocardia transvalensis]MBF6329778.1 aminoglycoside phosphotransferase family protein [Nocardia transvalensis]